MQPSVYDVRGRSAGRAQAGRKRKGGEEKGCAREKNDPFSGRTHEMAEPWRCENMTPLVLPREGFKGKKGGGAGVMSYRMRIV